MRGARRIAVGAVVLTTLVVVIARLFPDIAPDSDLALIDTYVLHVIRHGFPLGAYSRLGWNHPGPLFFQLLAPLYWLSGYRHLAILLTVALLNAGCVIGVFVLLVRRHTTLFVTAALLFFLYFARMHGLLASPWNPHAALMPFALLVVAAAAVAAGSTRGLPVVAFLGSLIVQLHASFLPITAAIFGLVAIVVSIRYWPRREGRTNAPALLRALGLTALVLAVVWAFPIADAIRPTGQHNMQAIAAFVRKSTPFDPAAATRMVEHLFVSPFTPGLKLWNGTPLPSREPVVHVVAQVEAVLLAAIAIGALLRRRRFEAAFAGTVFVSIAAALVAAQRVPEAPQEYAMLAVSILGVLSWAAIGSAVVDLALAAVRRSREPRTTRRWMTIAAAAATITFCARDVIAFRASEMTWLNRNIGLSTAVRTYLDARGARSVLVHVPQEYWGIATSVVQQLYRSGIAPTVDADWVSMFGRPLAPTGQEAATIQFAREEEGSDDLDHRSTHVRLGRAAEFFVYGVTPNPSSRPSAGAARIIDRSSDLTGAERLLDHLWSATDASPASPTAVSFLGATRYVTMDMTEAAPIGLRVWGQPESVWQLRCSADGKSFVRAGRISIGAGAGTQAGETFLRDLAACRQLKIAPVTEGAVSWLSEVQVLVSGGTAAAGR